MQSFSPDVKKYPGAASCALRIFLVEHFLRVEHPKTDRPQTLLGQSVTICNHQAYSRLTVECIIFATALLCKFREAP